MRYSAMFLAAATLLGCSAEGAGPSAVTEGAGPSAAPPVNIPTQRALVWGMVIEETGICIEGASVRVVSGQAAGQTQVQQTPCDAWWFGGFEFKDLTPGVAMTIRASAPGYVPKDTTVVPSSSGVYAAMLIVPTRE